MKRFFVGNLPYDADETQLREWFARAGVVVQSVYIVRNRFSGESRGFGFLETPVRDAAKALQGCNGRDFQGRTLVIDDARPERQPTPRPRIGDYRGLRLAR